MARRSKSLQAARQTQNNDDVQSVTLRGTRVLYRNLESRAPIVVNRGGAGSSKSHSIAQLLLHKFFTEQGKKILVLRKALPSLRISTLLLFYDLLDQLQVRNEIIEEKVMLNFLYGDSMIHFGSVDDAEKIKSSEWNYIWLEEATEFSFDEYKTIRLRLRAPSRDGIPNQMYLSFNPIDEYHWIKTDLVDDPTYNKDIEEIVSNYKDNPFLPQDYLQQLFDLEHQDRAFYDIYTRGEWGKFGNLIYDNWDIIRLEDMPDRKLMDRTGYGLDFGYNEPTALVDVGYKGRDAYVRQLIYAQKLTNSDLIERMQRLIPPDRRRDIIWADSAEPGRIEEIQRTGLFRIKAAQKNVLDGIDTVKRFRVHVTNDSPDLIKEKRAYSWKKDRNGHVLDQPIEFLDHAVSAERYAIYSMKKGGAGVRISVIR